MCGGATDDAPASAPPPGPCRLPRHITPAGYRIKLTPNLDTFVFNGEVEICLNISDAVSADDVSTLDSADLISFARNQLVLHGADIAVSSASLALGVHESGPDTQWLEAKGIDVGSETKLVTLTFEKDIHVGSSAPTTPAGTTPASRKALLAITYTGVLADSMCGFYRSTYTVPASAATPDELKKATAAAAAAAAASPGSAGGAPLDAAAAASEVKDVTRYMGVTQFEAVDARRALPCFDEPWFKAWFEVTIAARKGLVVLSNMHETATYPAQVPSFAPALASTAAAPAAAAAAAAAAPAVAPSAAAAVAAAAEVASGEVASGEWETHEFSRTPQMSTYLLAFAVGELEYIESVITLASMTTTAGVPSTSGPAPVVRHFASRKLPVRVYTTPGKKAHAAYALEIAAKSVEFFEEFFGIDYPLPKLDLIAVPDFNAGAMENFGLITFRGEFGWGWGLGFCYGAALSVPCQVVAVLLVSDLLTASTSPLMPSSTLLSRPPIPCRGDGAGGPCQHERTDQAGGRAHRVARGRPSMVRSPHCLPRLLLPARTLSPLFLFLQPPPSPGSATWSPWTGGRTSG